MSVDVAPWGDERVIIIGSGPSAAGVVLALLRRGAKDVTVVDLGGALDAERREAADQLSALSREQWDRDRLDLITQQPVSSDGGLPQKRSFGSDYPFRDLGQLDGLSYVGGANSSPVSSALGGFSNVWGAQLMPFSRATFDTWPFSFDDLEPHYRAVLDEVPLAGEADDLLEYFPLLSDTARPLPPLAPGNQATLDRYATYRARVRGHGVTLGKARLALRASSCVSCGLCMTGCPLDLIYSASQTIERLRREGRVRYVPGTLVTGLAEDDEGCLVRVRATSDGCEDTLRADRVFVGAGGIGSTRLVLGSLPDAPRELEMSESIQFAIPFLSRHYAGDVRTQDTFTLNQFNVLISLDEVQHSTAHIHCYPYNPAVLGALPTPLQHPRLSALTAQMLGRLTIGLGYLPSWASPALRLRLAGRTADGLAQISLGSAEPSTPLMLTEVLRRLRRVARPLDLYPVAQAIKLGAPGKSYHFGASFPHRRENATATGTDLLGRPKGWTRTHLVDGSVLPSVPSTTFTFTVMANAHRIASQVRS